MGTPQRHDISEVQGPRTMRVGYVRVSSVDQNTVRQLDGIAVERIFTDKASGKDTIRPKLDEMLAFVHDGDTVIVHSMDRLARNLDDLRRILRTLTGKGVQVEFVKENLTFTGEDSPLATLLLSVMGAFAEFERALILERRERSELRVQPCSNPPPSLDQPEDHPRLRLVTCFLPASRDSPEFARIEGSSRGTRGSSGSMGGSGP
jgi:Resolvase, N terminal domain